MSSEGNKQFYTSVPKAVSVEVGQRRDRRKESELILKWAEKNGKILEIGSNLGYFTGLVAKESGSHVVGIDTNTSKWLYKIAHLRNKKDSTSFVQGQNFTKIKDPVTGEDKETGFPFKDASFDQAIMSHVIEHFEDPTVLVNEVKRILKDDGTIIVAVPRERFLGENTKDHKVLYESLEQLRSQLESYGFELVEEKDFGLGESAVIKMKKKPSRVEGQPELKSKNEDNTFLDVDKMVDFINTSDLWLMQAGFMTGDITLDYDHWGRSLLKAAKDARGNKKIKYALALKRFELLIGSEKYGEMLRTLMITPERIDELIYQSEKVEGLLARIKRIFKEAQRDQD